MASLRLQQQPPLPLPKQTMISRRKRKKKPRKWHVMFSVLLVLRTHRLVPMGWTTTVPKALSMDPFQKANARAESHAPNNINFPCFSAVSLESRLVKGFRWSHSSFSLSQVCVARVDSSWLHKFGGYVGFITKPLYRRESWYQDRRNLIFSFVVIFNLDWYDGTTSNILFSHPVMLLLLLLETYHMIDRCDSSIATWSSLGDNFVVKNVEKFASVSHIAWSSQFNTCSFEILRSHVPYCALFYFTERPSLVFQAFELLEFCETGESVSNSCYSIQERQHRCLIFTRQGCSNLCYFVYLSDSSVFVNSLIFMVSTPAWC